MKPNNCLLASNGQLVLADFGKYFPKVASPRMQLPIWYRPGCTSSFTYAHFPWKDLCLCCESVKDAKSNSTPRQIKHVHVLRLSQVLLGPWPALKETRPAPTRTRSVHTCECFGFEVSPQDLLACQALSNRLETRCGMRIPIYSIDVMNQGIRLTVPQLHVYRQHV